MATCQDTGPVKGVSCAATDTSANLTLVRTSATTDAQTLIGFLRGMRAVRRFAPTPLPDEVLEDILQAGRWTGSSKNTQPWHVIVIRDRQMLETLAGCGPYAGHLAGAAAALALVMEDESRRFDEGRLAQNLMLAAWAHGVGSCIGSIYPANNNRRAKTALGVPDKKWLHTTISFGYPADEQALRLSANPGNLTEVPIGRREVSDVVSWERFGNRR
jgi:nitroreductase